MGNIKPPEPALLFIAALYSDPEVFDLSGDVLTEHFGEFLMTSDPMPWDYSSHYQDELGCHILRQFIFFKNLIDPGNLADIKLKTNNIEDSLSAGGKRRINLDPGYLMLSKIILASTKNYAHRIYVGKGIYAEVTLIFKNNTFTPHLFTYRDYQEKAYIDLFLKAREKLKEMH